MTRIEELIKKHDANPQVAAYFHLSNICGQLKAANQLDRKPDNETIEELEVCIQLLLPLVTDKIIGGLEK
jgi:hypothetical protein